MRYFTNPNEIALTFYIWKIKRNNHHESSKREAKTCFEDSNRIYIYIYIYVKYVY